jgi:predicted nucleotidyltransferase
MPRDWEEQFREWAKPPGKTEQDRCDNAASAIRNAIKASDKLRTRGVSVFAHGSYRNNTNVRKDSDVDIGILCTDTFFHNPLPEGWTQERLGFSDSTYHYDQYKNEVEEALVNYFGRSAVKRGNKAFDIHETSYHVEADVAAFFEHRRYLSDGTYLEGVELRTDKENRRIINWPEQHYKNGTRKNTDTGTRFKSIVRVLKSLSNEMNGTDIQAGDVPSFLVECLVWNVPNDQFQHYTYTADIRAVLTFLFNNTMTQEACKEWGEVSELIYLFNSSQKWTWQQAHGFTSAAWDYIGFKD